MPFFGEAAGAALVAGWKQTGVKYVKKISKKNLHTTLVSTEEMVVFLWGVEEAHKRLKYIPSPHILNPISHTAIHPLSTLVQSYIPEQILPHFLYILQSPTDVYIVHFNKPCLTGQH